MNIKRALFAGSIASTMAFGLAVSAPAPAAQAEAGGRWYIVNQYNGKRVKGTGYKKKFVLATCRKKDAFHWNNYGSSKYANFSATTFAGAACLAHNGKNKPVCLSACQGGAGTGAWGLASLNNGAKTPIAHTKCGYMQAVSKTALKCGKRPANQKKMTWIIKYSL
ncbi:hypothetical protein OHS59_16720 [Streptomyces sp. NBC_00414]|uniref:hypothetical protein n=1 Tax=Streptomyces sp. NBC_00414 TaxID=2975739 RepID=UPI002E20E1FE